MEKDRRKYNRVNVMMPAVFETDPAEVSLKERDFCIATVKNISAGGVLLRSSTYLPSGTVVSLQINLHQTFPPVHFSDTIEKNIHVTAKFVSFRKQLDDKYEMGVEFIGLEPEDRKNILKMVDCFKQD